MVMVGGFFLLFPCRFSFSFPFFFFIFIAGHTQEEPTRLEGFCSTNPLFSIAAPSPISLSLEYLNNK